MTERNWTIRSIAFLAGGLALCLASFPLRVAAYDAGVNDLHGGTTVGTGTSDQIADVHNDQNLSQDLKSKVAEPVDLYSGQFEYERADVSVPNCMPLRIQRFYRSGSTYQGMFGRGWSMAYNERIFLLADGNLLLRYGNSRRDEFTNNEDDTFSPPAGMFDTIHLNADGSYTRRSKHGTVREYDSNGCLTVVRDRHQNELVLTYETGGKHPINAVSEYSHYDNAILVARDYRLTKIEVAHDGALSGRFLDFTYDANGRVTTTTDFTGRSWDYTYDGADSGELVSVTTPAVDGYPAGLTTAYSYTDDHRLRTITDPAGQTFLTNHYDSVGRVMTQNWGDATYLFEYPSDTLRRVTDGNGYVTERTFDSDGNVLTRSEYTAGLRPDDPASYTTTYEYNENHQQTKARRPSGNVEEREYDTLGNLLELRREPVDGPNSPADIVSSYTYETNFNLVKTATDPRGFTTTYTYDYEDGASGRVVGDMTAMEYPVAVASATASWPHKLKIQFSGYDKGETLTNFPALVIFDSALPEFDYGQLSSPDAADLRFTDSGMTGLLDHEIEEWNTNGRSYVWVKLPVLSGSNDWIWAYWGNTNACIKPSEAECAATWSEGFRGVWHLNESVFDEAFDGSHQDSTGLDHAGCQHGNSRVLGKVAGAQAFDEGNDFIEVGDFCYAAGQGGHSTNFSVSFWYKLEDNEGTLFQYMFSHGDVGSSGSLNVYCGEQSHGTLSDVLRTKLWTRDTEAYGDMSNCTDQVWHHYALSVVKGATRIFIDGGTESLHDWGQGGDPFDPLGDIFFGARNDLDAERFLGGRLDEIRISTVARSSDWIWACYMNQASNDNFCTYGPVLNEPTELPVSTYDYASVALTYNDYGQVETVTDPIGTVTKYEYDPATGYLLKRISAFWTPIAATNSYTYAACGNMLTYTDPRGNTTTYQYNNLDRLVQVTAPAPFTDTVTKYTYNANSKVSQIERKTGDPTHPWQTITYTYDILDHLKTVTDDMGHTTTYEYDGNNNRTKVIDANGNATQYAYDERDLLWKATDALTNATEYAYDLNGNLSQLTDANGNLTLFAYDGFDRLVTNTYANGSTEIFGYNPAGNVTAKTTRAGQTIAYSYDPRNRLDLKTYPDDSTVDYVYDIAGRLLRVTDTNGVISHAYDACDRLTVVTNTFGHVVAYEYDAAGNRAKLVYPDNTFITYGFDDLNRLTNIWRGGTSRVARFAYDALGRRTQLALDNGTRAQYTYDWGNSLTSLHHTVTNTGATLAQYGYTDDSVGNRLTVTTIGVGYPGTHTYGYDKTYQLRSTDYPDGYPFPDETFSYDALGNRTTVVTTNTTTYVANNLNQYATVGGVQFDYDLNGNLTADGVLSLGYDPENRLVVATRLGTNIVYKYDAFGRRIEKNVNGTILRFTYAGDQIVAEHGSSGTLLRKYIFGTGIDEPLCMDAGTNRFYYHADGLATVVCLTDIAGERAAVFTYSITGQGAFGPLLIGNRFMFMAREYDVETCLYDYRTRHYSPRLGSFFQTDSIGLLGGIALYRFVDNNPVNYVDPRGLFVFGKRPLTDTPWIPIGSSNPIDDYLNTEISHEHGFFEDNAGGNLGFGPGGRFSETPSGKGYRYGEKHYDDAAMREALDRVKDGDYSLLGNRDKPKNNCQDWAERLRREYEKVKKEWERDGRPVNEWEGDRPKSPVDKKK